MEISILLLYKWKNHVGVKPRVNDEKEWTIQSESQHSITLRKRIFPRPSVRSESAHGTGELKSSLGVGVGTSFVQNVQRSLDSVFNL